MHRNFGMLSVLAVAGTVMAGACSDGSNNPTLSEGGQIRVLLTDAPFPYSQVKSVDVYVKRVEAKLADTDSAQAADTTDTSWKTLVTPNTKINLLTLTNGQTTTLGIVSVPAGTYRSFRLIINPDSSSVTLNDNTKPNIVWPSAAKSGIKIILTQPFQVTNGTVDLLIDFDVGRSFVMRGNSISQNGLLFKPVIHATATQSTGSVAGSVRAESATGAGVAGATVEVLKNGTALDDTNENNVVRTAMTDGSGAFTLAFVPPGSYVVRATPPAA